MAKFWMVVVEGGSAPNARHPAIDTARKEAARLAASTGRKAIVLEAIESCEPISNVVWEKV